MEQTKSDALPADIEAVRQGIEEWRQTRAKRTRMPEDLWQAAVSLAREHGLWRISRALRVRYEGLKSRLAPAKARSAEPKDARFVELGPALGRARGEAGVTTVELSRADGARLSLRVPDGGVDVQSLMSAFCQPSS